MESHPAVIFANPGETAEASAVRQAGYTAIYKAVSLEVFTGGFFIAGLICLLALMVAIWLKRNPASNEEAGLVF